MADQQNGKAKTRNASCQTNLDLINMEKLIECSIAMRKLQTQERKRAVITQLQYPTVDLSNIQVSTNLPRSRTTDQFHDIATSSVQDQNPFQHQQNYQPPTMQDNLGQPRSDLSTKDFNLKCDEKEILESLYRMAGNVTAIHSKLEVNKMIADAKMQH